MTNIPVNSGVNLEDWWQLKAYSIEWLYVIDKLAKTVKNYTPKDPQYIIGVSLGDTMPLYMFRKSIFPAPQIAAALGLTVEQLLEHKGEINLKSNKVEGLPSPTVDYWGTG